MIPHGIIALARSLIYTVGLDPVKLFLVMRLGSTFHILENGSVDQSLKESLALLDAQEAQIAITGLKQEINGVPVGERSSESTLLVFLMANQSQLEVV